jgi:hypothetical protein
MEMPIRNKIEFVCLANHGRSPLAELFAKKYLDEHGITNYQAISSGSRYDERQNVLRGKKSLTDKQISDLIHDGIRGNHFDVDKANRLWSYIDKAEISNDAKKELSNEAITILRKFDSDEEDYRAVALVKFNLGIPSGSVQTIARPDTLVVLGMGKDNLDFVNDLYKGRPLPLRDTLKGFASGETGAGFSSAYGKGLTEYLSMAEEIRGYVHKSLDRLF